ncbi:MAG: type I restriction endonuclease [Armatimonadota bacterium]
MAFADSVRTLSNQIAERRAHVATEEATKQALILPFIALLGFDIYNPAEVIPEYRAGWAKQTEKIDYALLIAKKLAVFIEAKGPNEVLANYDPQLAKYFNSTPDVKFAIITNGVQFRFFTDLQERNILDKKPFFEFDFEDFTDADIATLERFRKEVFNAEALVGYAEDLVFLSALKSQFKTLLRDPSDDLIRFAVGTANLVEGRITQKVVDRFRPLVKESISGAILEIVGQSFAPAMTMVEPIVEPPAVAEEDLGPRVITTEEEMAAYQLIAEMLADQVPDPGQLRYQDTQRYFSLLYAKTTGWFVRFVVQGKDNKKMLGFRLPVERVRELAPGVEVDEPPTWIGASRVYFREVEDLRALAPVFAAAVREVL